MRFQNYSNHTIYQFKEKSFINVLLFRYYELLSFANNMVPLPSVNNLDLSNTEDCNPECDENETITELDCNDTLEQEQPVTEKDGIETTSQVNFVKHET